MTRENHKIPSASWMPVHGLCLAAARCSQPVPQPQQGWLPLPRGQEPVGSAALPGAQQAWEPQATTVKGTSCLRARTLPPEILARVSPFFSLEDLSTGP